MYELLNAHWRCKNSTQTHTQTPIQDVISTYIRNYVNYLQIIPTKYIHTYYRFAPKLQTSCYFIRLNWA